jgi:hypothetical protein
MSSEIIRTFLRGPATSSEVIVTFLSNGAHHCTHAHVFLVKHENGIKLDIKKMLRQPYVLQIYHSGVIVAVLKIVIPRYPFKGYRIS